MKPNQLLRREKTRAVMLLNELELRTVPAGTTVITHGYTFPLTTQFGSDSWIRVMGNAIAGRTPGPDVILMYDFSASQLRFDGGAQVPTDFTTDPANEYIVYTNWEASSSNSTPGWAEAVAEGLYGTLRRFGLADANRPLHFIGHSYGTVVNSETVQRLGFLDNMTVDQMTTLDPHDFFESFTGFISPNFEADVDMPDVHVWSNVTYADNYYNTAGKSTLFDPLPHGRALDGPLDKAAINNNLSTLPGFSVNGHQPHSRVHRYYVRTIDPNAEIFDSVDTSQWFVGPSTNYGYRFSRVGGTPAERADHFSGYTQRTSLATPPFNAEDVGVDPPTRIYNGDFFNTKIASNNLAGFTNAPQITGAPTNPAALLNNADTTFTHAAVWVPATASGFAFDYNVTAPSAVNTLSITFRRDDDQAFTFTDTEILKSAGAGVRILNTATFPTFTQLAGRMASISFTLNQTQAGSALTVDNLRLVSLPTVQSIAINDGSVQRSRVTSLTATFSGLVNLPAPAANAFHLSGPSGSVAFDVDLGLSTPTQTIARLTFNGAGTEFGSLMDGRYSLTILGNQVADALGQLLDGDGDGIAGGNSVTLFHRLFGDADGNATVNTADFAAFRSAFGGSSSIFDFDNVGGVGTSDFAQFRTRFGASV